ncbi:hypothetical protein F5141DRAFT_204269 [Pisolithus sp. B1]|nr:hypothetical protein F5141DRAFT_204269 [Pisolithus sp. B1]
MLAVCQASQLEKRRLYTRHQTLLKAEILLTSVRPFGRLDRVPKHTSETSCRLFSNQELQRCGVIPRDQDLAANEIGGDTFVIIGDQAKSSPEGMRSPKDETRVSDSNRDQVTAPTHLGRPRKLPRTVMQRTHVSQSPSAPYLNPIPPPELRRSSRNGRAPPLNDDECFFMSIYEQRSLPAVSDMEEEREMRGSEESGIEAIEALGPSGDEASQLYEEAPRPHGWKIIDSK